jgi:hypothetical protein
MEEDRQYTYGYKALTGIYLGDATPEEQKEIVCLVLHGSSTSLYQVIQKDDEFSLASREFTYTLFQYTEKRTEA